MKHSMLDNGHVVLMQISISVAPLCMQATLAEAGDKLTRGHQLIDRFHKDVHKALHNHTLVPDMHGPRKAAI